MQAGGNCPNFKESGGHMLKFLRTIAHIFLSTMVIIEKLLKLYLCMND